MRSNRPTYSASPAGSSKALDQKPKPKKSRREFNQLMLLVFFVLLPVIGLLAIFFQPVRWVFLVAVVAALAMMWVSHAFLFPGRTILSAVYGLAFVFTLVTALSASSSGSNVRQQQVGFLTPIPQATATPQFNYSTMSTSVPDGYYEGGTLVETQDVGISGGSVDESTEDLGLTDAGASYYVPAVKSDAEIALENFMERWRKGIIADMVEYTSASWQAEQNENNDSGAAQQLFWKFMNRPLVDWRQMSAPTGTDESTARTITIQADVSYSGETRTYQYDAITLNENGKWAVDPNSLSSGILVEQATPTPDPNITPTPEPEPTPTPTPGPKTKLYYNKNGGKKYHIDPECYTVDKQYLPLSSFTYGDLSKSPYNKLEPCDKCGAPAKP